MRVMKQQMISKFLQKDFESKLKVEDVPDADVEKYYKEHPDEFNQKDEVRVSEILVKDKAKADKAYAEAQALPKAADRRRPEGVPRSGDEVLRGRGLEAARRRPVVLRQGLDRLSRSRSSRRRSSSTRSATSRRRSRPTRAGPIIRLTQKRPGFNRPLAEVKRQIQQRLFRDLRTKAMDTFVADLKKKSKIEHQRGEPGQGASIETGAGAAALAMPARRRACRRRDAPGAAPGHGMPAQPPPGARRAASRAAVPQGKP